MNASSSPSEHRSTLTFASDARTAFVDHVLDLVERTSGVRLVPAGAETAPDVYHGNDDARPCLLRIPLVAAYDAASIPRPPLPATEGHAFGFDLFAAVRFWIADEGNAGATDADADEHLRLLPARSVHVALGLAETPVVNAYLIALRDALAATGAATRSHLPPGKRCAIVLSHDVDSPIDPGSPWHALRLGAANLLRGRRVVESGAYAAGAAVHAARSRLRDPSARHALFDRIVDAEERHGFGSTFFFAATSRFAPGGCRRDVGYDVAVAPLPAVLRRLRERGTGIGLHVGYLAAPSAERIRAERLRLEAAAGPPVRTSRHHYFHLGRPPWETLLAHGDAGLEVDTSVCFNDVPGYRLGIALPFRPWSPERERPSSTVQVPTMLMDSMLFGGGETDVDAAAGRAAALIATLKEHEGVASVDWHEYTSFPGSRRYRAWGEGYLALLELLASDPEVAVLPLEEAAELTARAP